MSAVREIQELKAALDRVAARSAYEVKSGELAQHYSDAVEAMAAMLGIIMTAKGVKYWRKAVATTTINDAINAVTGSVFTFLIDYSDPNQEGGDDV